MRSKISALILCFVSLFIGLSCTIMVDAQTGLDARVDPVCKQKLLTKTNLLDNGGDFLGIFNIQANLPFLPEECGKDVGGIDPYTKQQTVKSTTAIPVKYFPYVLYRVYRFIISLGFYLFGLGLVTTGVLIQTSAFSGDTAYQLKLKTYIRKGVTGIFTILFAYYVVFIILWIFNADSLLTETILKP
jgi:hypothetical protein